MLLFSVLYLCTLPSTVRLSRKTAELRPQLSGMASELSRISDEDGAVLLKAANDIISREYQFYSREPNEMNEHLFETAKALHETLVTEPLSRVATAAVFLLYLVSWSIPLICCFFPISIRFVTNHPAP